jgi:hypothetical protein
MLVVVLLVGVVSNFSALYAQYSTQTGAGKTFTMLGDLGAGGQEGRSERVSGRQMLHIVKLSIPACSRGHMWRTKEASISITRAALPVALNCLHPAAIASLPHKLQLLYAAFDCLLRSVVWPLVCLSTCLSRLASCKTLR